MSLQIEHSSSDEPLLLLWAADKALILALLLPDLVGVVLTSLPARGIRGLEELLLLLLVELLLLLLSSLLLMTRFSVELEGMPAMWPRCLCKYRKDLTTSRRLDIPFCKADKNLESEEPPISHSSPGPQLT